MSATDIILIIIGVSIFVSVALVITRIQQSDQVDYVGNSLHQVHESLQRLRHLTSAFKRMHLNDEPSHRVSKLYFEFSRTVGLININAGYDLDLPVDKRVKLSKDIASLLDELEELKAFFEKHSIDDKHWNYLLNMSSQMMLSFYQKINDPLYINSDGDVEQFKTIRNI